MKKLLFIATLFILSITSALSQTYFGNYKEYKSSDVTSYKVIKTPISVTFVDAGIESFIVFATKTRSKKHNVKIVSRTESKTIYYRIRWENGKESTIYIYDGEIYYMTVYTPDGIDYTGPILMFEDTSIKVP